MSDDNEDVDGEGQPLLRGEAAAVRRNIDELLGFR